MPQSPTSREARIDAFGNPWNCRCRAHPPLAFLGCGYGIDWKLLSRLGGLLRSVGAFTGRLRLPVLTALAAIKVQPARSIAFADRLRRVLVWFFGERDLRQINSDGCRADDECVAHFRRRSVVAKHSAIWLWVIGEAASLPPHSSPASETREQVHGRSITVDYLQMQDA